MFASTAYAQLQHPEKVGIGVWEVGNQGVSLSNVEQMNFGWYYNWRTDHLWAPTGAQRTVPFYPTIAKEENLNNTIASDAANILFGFNEPDNKDMANMTVDRAIQLWPELMSHNIPLCSPSPTTGQALSDTSWLSQFMQKAKAKNYRVDYICVHYYAESTDPSLFKKFLEDVYNKYGKEVIVTEWSLVDWNNPGRFSVDQIAQYANDATIMMDSLSFVKMHAWFSATEYNQYGNIRTHLFDQSNNLTAIGEVFEKLLSGQTTSTNGDGTTTPTDTNTTNLLSNSSFDSGLQSWENWGNSTTLSINSNAVARTGTGAGGVAQQLQNLDPNKKYSLTIEASIDSSNEAWVGIKHYNSNWQQLDDINQKVSGSSMARYNFNFSPPPGTVYSYVYTWKSSGSGFLYADNLVLSVQQSTGTSSNGETTTPTDSNSTGNDSNSNTGSSTSADTQAPTVKLLSPVNGETVKTRTRITMAASAEDNDKVVRVDFIVNSRTICSVSSKAQSGHYECRYRTPRRAKTRIISVKAYDASGNTAETSKITINVQK